MQDVCVRSACGMWGLISIEDRRPEQGLMLLTALSQFHSHFFPLQDMEKVYTHTCERDGRHWVSKEQQKKNVVVSRNRMWLLSLCVSMTIHNSGNTS